VVGVVWRWTRAAASGIVLCAAPEERYHCRKDDLEIVIRAQRGGIEAVLRPEVDPPELSRITYEA
jgi:hypothetical protein